MYGLGGRVRGHNFEHASPCQQEVEDMCIGSMGYADDTYPLRQDGKCMPAVMRMTELWLGLTAQKVNPKKSLAI